MVDLSSGPTQHSFDNSVFILPALAILGLVGKSFCFFSSWPYLHCTAKKLPKTFAAIVTYKLVTSLQGKQKKLEDKRRAKDEKKKKK